MDKLAAPPEGEGYSAMPKAVKSNWIVVTDLDGTLLDHKTYSFQPAKKTLQKLEENGIPVIINSSKTAAEIKELRQALNNKHPFIVENGSGILVPKNYFREVPEGANDLGDYWEVILGKPRQALLDELYKLPEALQQQFTNYQRCSVLDIMDMTGLSRTEAMRSMDRQYTEPLKWLGSDEEKQQFFSALRKQHLHCTEGGRFVHVMGYTNKGSAISWLTQFYQRAFGKPAKAIALGDAPNDIDMLKVADIAVVIRSPVNPEPVFEHDCKIVSEKTGASGWSEIIESTFFKQ